LSGDRENLKEVFREYREALAAMDEAADDPKWEPFDISDSNTYWPYEVEDDSETV